MPPPFDPLVPLDAAAPELEPEPLEDALPELSPEPLELPPALLLALPELAFAPELALPELALPPPVLDPVLPPVEPLLADEACRFDPTSAVVRSMLPPTELARVINAMPIPALSTARIKAYSAAVAPERAALMRFMVDSEQSCLNFMSNPTKMLQIVYRIHRLIYDHILSLFVTIQDEA